MERYTRHRVHNISTRPSGEQAASDVQTFRGIFKHSTFNFITMETAQLVIRIICFKQTFLNDTDNNNQ